MIIQFYIFKFWDRSVTSQLQIWLLQENLVNTWQISWPPYLLSYAGCLLACILLNINPSQFQMGTFEIIYLQQITNIKENLI